MKLGKIYFHAAASLLGILFYAFSGFASTAPTPLVPPFEIAPYIFSQHGESLTVGFSYGHEITAPRRIQMRFSNSKQTQLIEATSHGGQFLIPLPVAQCGFGQNVTYFVPGMVAAAKVNEIPCAGQNGTARFTFIADTQEGVVSDHAFADAIKAFNGSALIVGGDLVQHGSADKEWLRFFQAMAPVTGSQVLIPVVGNHEYRQLNSVPLWKHFFNFEAADGYYAVDLGPAHVIVLNSAFWNDSSLPLRQLVWLESELAKPSRFKIVTFHHPPFTKGIFSNSAYPKKEYRELQAEYVPLFEKYEVDLVLNGHTHMYEHSYKQGVHYVTTGAAGGVMGILGGKNPYELHFAKVRTMVQVEASENGLRATSKTLDGHIVDSIYIQK